MTMIKVASLLTILTLTLSWSTPALARFTASSRRPPRQGESSQLYNNPMAAMMKGWFAFGAAMMQVNQAMLGIGPRASLSSRASQHRGGTKLLAPDTYVRPATTRKGLVLQTVVLKKQRVVSSTSFDVPHTVTPGKRLMRLAGTVWGLYKPNSLSTRHGIRAGTDSLRERAFAVTGYHMGMDVVPATALRRYRGKVGSVQAWTEGKPAVTLYTIDASKKLSWIPERVSRLDWDSVQAMMVLDYVTNNRDRHFNNILLREVDGRQKVVAIDNGFCFAPRGDEELKTAGYDLLAVGAAVGYRQLSPKVWNRVKRTNERLLARHLRRIGMSRIEVSDALERLGHVKRSGLAALYEHPVPGLGKGYIDYFQMFTR